MTEDRHPAVADDADAETTIDVDPDWIAQLRAETLGEPTPPDSDGGSTVTFDGEITVDASPALLDAIQASLPAARVPAEPHDDRLPAAPTWQPEQPPQIPDDDPAIRLPAAPTWQPEQPPQIPDDQRWSPTSRLNTRPPATSAVTIATAARARRSRLRVALIAVGVGTLVVLTIWGVVGRGGGALDPPPTGDTVVGDGAGTETDGTVAVDAESGTGDDETEATSG
jgi:hypothetical protein